MNALIASESSLEATSAHDAMPLSSNTPSSDNAVDNQAWFWQGNSHIFHPDINSYCGP
jgi:hypothetical protein